jgi:hypothetical protein
VLATVWTKSAPDGKRLGSRARMQGRQEMVRRSEPNPASRVHVADVMWSPCMDDPSIRDQVAERPAKRDRAADEAAQVGPQRSAFLNPDLFLLLPQAYGSAPRSRIFQSWFLGGFECSTHRRSDGRRLDLTASTRHDANAGADYAMLAEHGIRTVRDGLRWHLIEVAPGRYDWSSFLPMLRAARDTGTQVIWDLAHYGWPDDIDIWSPAFVERFGRFAGEAARIVREETGGVPFYVPVNEVSFWAWAGGDVAYMNPMAEDRGPELKEVLVRAAITAIEAVRSVEPRARFVHAEPAIHVHPKSNAWADRKSAREYTTAVYEVWDWISGRLRPELGGRPDYLDIVGVNYYAHNQWIDDGTWIEVDHPLFRPVHQILRDIHARYRRPMVITETGIEAGERAAWLRFMGGEVAQARALSVPIEGICLYPITDYPGWLDDRQCPTGLFGYVAADGTRPVHQPLADELFFQQHDAGRSRRRNG